MSEVESESESKFVSSHVPCEVWKRCSNKAEYWIRYMELIWEARVNACESCLQLLNYSWRYDVHSVVKLVG